MQLGGKDRKESLRPHEDARYLRHLEETPLSAQTHINPTAYDATIMAKLCLWLLVYKKVTEVSSSFAVQMSPVFKVAFSILKYHFMAKGAAWRVYFLTG